MKPSPCPTFPTKLRLRMLRHDLMDSLACKKPRLSRAPKLPVATEEQEAFWLASWLTLNDVFFIHIPNEGKRSRRAAQAHGTAARGIGLLHSRFPAGASFAQRRLGRTQAARRQTDRRTVAVLDPCRPPRLRGILDRRR